MFQHATFEFALSGVSRQLVWSFLHGFPFYNTEQQSQRYVRLDERARARAARARRRGARASTTAAIERGWARLSRADRRADAA